MSSASSVLPSDLVSVEVAAQQVGAHPQTSLTRCTFAVLYPVPAPERGPRWESPYSITCYNASRAGRRSFPMEIVGKVAATIQNVLGPEAEELGRATGVIQ